MNKIIFVFLISLLVINIPNLAQDSTRSHAFKNANPQNDIYPLVKPQTNPYPLMAGYLLRKKANEGDPLAQHELGLRLLLGKGFAKDSISAVYWVKKAVEKNLTVARFNYGIMLNSEIATEWNPFEAYWHFRFGAENGMAQSQYIYAVFFTDNLVVTRNLTDAYKWFKKSAENGFEPANEALNQLKEMGIQDILLDEKEESAAKDSLQNITIHSSHNISNYGIELDLFDFGSDSLSEEDERKQIRSLLSKKGTELRKHLGVSDTLNLSYLSDTSGIGIIEFAVSTGSPEALLLSGRSLEEGILTKRNLILAAEKYLRAYRLGSRKAAEYLFRLTKDNHFFEALKKEVDRENDTAMFVWAGLVALGFDFRITNDQAFELLMKSVKMKNTFAIIEAGLCYYNGSLVEKDSLKAMQMWELADSLGNKEARIRIIFSRIKDQSAQVKQMKFDIEYLHTASEEGSVLAQALLAYCYENGIGLKRSKASAVNLYRSAAHRGNEAAYSSLKKMYDDVRPDDDEFIIFEN